MAILTTAALVFIPLQSGLPARFGGFLPSSVTEGFDISLFGLSGGEAELMDPQQRLLLEVSLEVRAHRLPCRVPPCLVK